MYKPLTYIFKRIKHPRKRFLWLNFLKQNEYRPIEHNKEKQKDLLYKMLEHSVNNVPYYRNISRKNNILLKRESVLENVKEFPILTKKILRSEFENLTAQNFQEKSFKNTSGGSTGEPAVFLQDQNYFEKGQSAKILFEKWAGKQPGGKKIRLWGSEKDILEAGQGVKAKMKEFLLNEKLLNTFRLSEQDMINYAEEINQFKPDIIEAYAHSIYEFSKFIKKNNIEIHSPAGVITSAGTLYPKMKELIKVVFKCPVLNRYGSREVGDIACSCEEDKGLHICLFNHFVEILDDNLIPCKPGQMGSIYVTTLHNRVMPLIRYKIGDIGIPAETEKCPCGRGLPLIKQIEGRIGSLIKTKKGVLDSTALTTSFYYYDSIKKYKVVQKKYDYVIIMVVIDNEEKWGKDKKDLHEKLSFILGSDIKIDFEIVPDIPPLKSGKYQYITSDVE